MRPGRKKPEIPFSSGRSPVLSLEHLEPRLALDSSGVLVGVDPHFTLSFAPDGTAVGQELSSLTATMNAIPPTVANSNWQETILRAFQTWAVNTNADIGLVDDGGQPFGIPGANQRDERFGDIRIGSSALSEVGAVSVPIDNIASGSWLADVIFNTEFNFRTLDDLYVVALHEAGNVFGLKDNADQDSPLYGERPLEDFDPTLLPTANDILNLQDLHGERAADANESHGGEGTPDVMDNNSLVNATRLKLATAYGGDEATGPTIAFGDIHDLSDQDYFVLKSPGDYSGPMTVQLTTRGVSLLQPELTVFDSGEQQLAHTSSNILGGSVATLQIPSVDTEQNYYFRVSAATSDVYAIGGFSLVVTFDGMNLVDQELIQDLSTGPYRFLSQDELSTFFDADEDDLVNDDDHSDDELNEGVELETAPSFAPATRYEVIGSISDASDADVYKIKSPKSNLGPLNVMTLAIRSLDSGHLVPALEVFDENDQIVSSQVIANGGGTLLVQVGGVDPDTDYSVRVAAEDPNGPFAVGNYSMAATFTETSAALESMAIGTVGGAVGQTEHTLYVGRPQLFHFALETGTAAVSTPTAVLVTVKDEQGNTVTRFAAATGQTRSGPAVLLNPGTYTAEFAVLALGGSNPPTVEYNLRGFALSDPFVGDPNDPTGHPFQCSENPEVFCYPGLPLPSDNPYLWDDFILSLSNPPADLLLEQLVSLLMGDWWSWYWGQTGENGPPLAMNDSYRSAPTSAAVVAAQTTPLNVLDNDLDPEGDAVVALLGTDVTLGTLNLHADGTFEYTPTSGFLGVDQFTYIAYDFITASSPATVEILVQLPGDYDNNAVVDTNDYEVWRSNLSSTELAADGNGDGFVDAADYSLWRNNLGASVPSSVTLAVTQDVQSIFIAALPAVQAKSSSWASLRNWARYGLTPLSCSLARLRQSAPPISTAATLPPRHHFGPPSTPP